MQQDAKREILDYIDERLHRSVVAIQPNRSSDEHRRRLNDLQIARLGEMEVLRSCISAQDVVTTFFTRAESGALDDVAHDAHDLGLPTIIEMLDAVRLKARALGLHCNEDMGVTFSSTVQRGDVKQLYHVAKHTPNDLKDYDHVTGRRIVLLDEGVEKSFPVGDPVSSQRTV